jgi:peptidoglycan/xylan/chitin deacetylase (PgdA/CDA1 family)
MSAAVFGVKRMIVHGLHATGLLHMWKRRALKRRAVVLMYHRVLPQHAMPLTWSHRGIVVTPETFAEQMRFLRTHFRVLSPAEFEARLTAGDAFDDGSCLVTFDDGWLDTFTHALPVLRQYQIPALVFLPSAYIGTGAMFWQERLGALLHTLWRKAQGDVEFAARIRPRLEEFGLASVLTQPAATVRDHIVEQVRARKAGNSADPFVPVRALADFVGDDAAPHGVDRFMDWEQVRAMGRDGIAFGVHGDTHRQLTALTAADVQFEFETCKRALEEALGTRPTTVSYPNGDCNETVVDAARREAFSVGFTTQPGRVDAHANRLLVRRVNIHEDTTRTMPMFLAKLVGAL